MLYAIAMRQIIICDSSKLFLFVDCQWRDKASPTVHTYVRSRFVFKFDEAWWKGRTAGGQNLSPVCLKHTRL